MDNFRQRPFIGKVGSTGRRGDIARHARQYRLRACRQPYDRSRFAHGPTALGPHRGAAAGGHHQPVPPAQIGDHLGFQIAEGRLTPFCEDRCDRLVRPAFDLDVGINPIPAQPLGHEPCQRGFPGSSIADQRQNHREYMARTGFSEVLRWLALYFLTSKPVVVGPSAVQVSRDAELLLFR